MEIANASTAFKIENRNFISEAIQNTKWRLQGRLNGPMRAKVGYIFSFFFQNETNNFFSSKFGKNRFLFSFLYGEKNQVSLCKTFFFCFTWKKKFFVSL